MDPNHGILDKRMICITGSLLSKDPCCLIFESFLAKGCIMARKGHIGKITKHAEIHENRFPKTCGNKQLHVTESDI